MRNETLQENSLVQIYKGKFKQTRIPSILLEVVYKEVTGKVIMLQTTDILGTDPKVWSDLFDKGYSEFIDGDNKAAFMENQSLINDL